MVLPLAASAHPNCRDNIMPAGLCDKSQPQEPTHCRMPNWTDAAFAWTSYVVVVGSGLIVCLVELAWILEDPLIPEISIVNFRMDKLQCTWYSHSSPIFLSRSSLPRMTWKSCGKFSVPASYARPLWQGWWWSFLSVLWEVHRSTSRWLTLTKDGRMAGMLSISRQIICKLEGPVRPPWQCKYCVYWLREIFVSCSSPMASSWCLSAFWQIGIIGKQNRVPPRHTTWEIN